MLDIERLANALPAYEIGGELGRGASGIVIAGRHRQLGRAVAIKQMKPELSADPAVGERFLAEARLLATLDHPHVVAIYDFVEQDGLCLLVMEHLTGGTVSTQFHPGGVSADVSCAILLALCAGLDHAHEHGVLHRDVKPENLMFSGRGTLKVTDLGIAKVIGGSATLATRAGEVLGTPAYIAPEQARGDELTPATDVYAAGTLFYWLLAGRLPFPVDSDPATMLYRHVHETPPPLMEVAHAVPAELAAIADRAISTSAANRQQSALELGVAIAHGAVDTWGPGWLSRTSVPVLASGPILAAALGESSIPPYRHRAVLHEAPPPPEPRDPVGGGFLPVQMLHPGLRSPAGDAAASSPPADVASSSGPTATPSPSPEILSPPAVSSPVPSSSAPASPVALGSESPGSSDDVAPPSLPVAGSSVPGAGSTDEGGRRWTQRRVVIPLALVAALIVAVVAAVVVLSSGSAEHQKTTAADNHPQATRGVTSVAAWRALPEAPTARQQVASTVFQGTLWVFGGLTEGAATTKVEGYDPAISTWETGPDLPQPLHHAMAVVYHGEMVVIGGWVPTADAVDGSVSNRVYALRHDKWVELAPLNHARAAGAAAVVGNKIIVAGGQADHQLVTSTEVFDGTSWTDVAAMPTPRDHLGAVSDGRYYYAVGGRALSADQNIGAVERYDPTDDHWDELPKMPTPRGGLGVAIVGTRLVTVGGESPTSVFNTVEALDLNTKTWSTLPPMKTPRHGLAVLTTGHTLFAIDGAVVPGHLDSVPTTEAIDLSGSPVVAAWRALPEAPTARQQVASTVFQGTLWVFGGLTEGAATTKVEGYDPAISTWETGPDLPQPLHHAMAVVYHGEMVVIGGWVPTADAVDGSVSNRVYALRHDKWVELAPLNHARAAGAAAVVGNKIIVAGGQADHQLVTSTEVFDGTSWTDVAAMPTPRDHLGAVSDGRYYYAVGGRALSADQNIGAVERYDPTDDHWDELPKMPTPRGGLGVAIVGTRLVTVGGESPTSVFNTVEALDLNTKTWSTLPPMKTPRHGLAVLTTGHTLFAIDGAVVPGHLDSVPTTEAIDLS